MTSILHRGMIYVLKKSSSGKIGGAWFDEYGAEVGNETQRAVSRTYAAHCAALERNDELIRDDRSPRHGVIALLEKFMEWNKAGAETTLDQQLELTNEGDTMVMTFTRKDA